MFSQYFITFFLSIVLSRMISPVEFGLTGMLSIFIALAAVMMSSGLGSALVFEKSTNEDDYSTVFYFNIFVSCSLYAIMFFCAPLIAKFYNQPELVSLARWISLVFVINSFSLIQDTLLVIDLNFKKQSLIRISGLIISVIVSIIMAINEYGVYSIVGQVIVQAAVNSTLYWILSSWRPVGKFSMVSFKKLWKYGSNILFSNLFTQLITNIDNLIIGKVFSPFTLGLFIRAKSTKAIPENIFSQSFQTAIFPILTKLNDNKEEFVQKHLMFFKMGSFFVFPLVTLLFFTSYEIVDILYGKKWLGAVPYLKIISFITIPYFLGMLFNQTLLSFGDSKLFMKLNMLRRMLGIINIPIAIYWGLIPYLTSMVILSFVGLLFDVLYTSRKISTRLIDYVPDFLLAALFTSIMAGFIFISIHFIPLHSYAAKAIGITGAIAIYIVLLYKFVPKTLASYMQIIASFTKRI